MDGNNRASKHFSIPPVRAYSLMIQDSKEAPICQLLITFKLFLRWHTRPRPSNESRRTAHRPPPSCHAPARCRTHLLPSSRTPARHPSPPSPARKRRPRRARSCSSSRPLRGPHAPTISIPAHTSLAQSSFRPAALPQTGPSQMCVSHPAAQIASGSHPASGSPFPLLFAAPHRKSIQCDFKVSLIQEQLFLRPRHVQSFPLSQIPSAQRSASAPLVGVGPTAPLVTNELPSTTHRFATSCASCH